MLFSLLISGIAFLLLAGQGEASVPRAFVSTTGSDTNPCSSAQPCRSFNQALTVVQPGGEIVVQDSGGYSSGFTIAQSVTIDAGGFNASVISTGATDLCTISAGASDRVVLRGISFHGAGVGNNAINAPQVGSLYVEHCSITEFVGDGIHMLNGGDLFLTDTDVRKCFNGVVASTSGATPVNLVGHDSRFTECSNTGVQFSSASNGAAATGTLINCTVALHSGIGFWAINDNFSSGGNVNLMLVNCRSIGNNQGILATSSGTPTSTIRMANCLVTQNSIGIGSGNGSVIGTNPGTNFLSGNSADTFPGSSVTLH
jgi:hypothetical protein